MGSSKSIPEKCQSDIKNHCNFVGPFQLPPPIHCKNNLCIKVKVKDWKKNTFILTYSVAASLQCCRRSLPPLRLKSVLSHDLTHFSFLLWVLQRDCAPLYSSWRSLMLVEEQGMSAAGFNSHLLAERQIQLSLMQWGQILTVFWSLAIYKKASPLAISRLWQQKYIRKFTPYKNICMTFFFCIPGNA